MAARRAGVNGIMAALGVELVMEEIRRLLPEQINRGEREQESAATRKNNKRSGYNKQA